MITGIIYECPECKRHFRFMEMIEDIMIDYKGFEFICSGCGYKEVFRVD